MGRWVRRFGTAAIATAVLLGLAAPVAEAQSSGGLPSIVSAVQGSTGAVLVTWTMPAGHTANNLHWHTSDATGAPPSASAEGAPMACYLTGPSDSKRSCTGGQDQGNAATSYSITGLAPGTYYAQVNTSGQKPGSFGSPITYFAYFAYSVPFKFTVTAVGTGGGGSPSTPVGSPSSTTVYVPGTFHVVSARGDSSGHLEVTWVFPEKWESVDVRWVGWRDTPVSDVYGKESVPASATTYTTKAVLPAGTYDVRASARSNEDGPGTIRVTADFWAVVPAPAPKPSASPQAPKLNVPGVGKEKTTVAPTADIIIYKTCADWKAGGFLNAGALATLRTAATNPKNSPVLRAKAKSAVDLVAGYLTAGYDKVGCPDENPRTAQAALDAVNKARQAANTAKAVADTTDRTADAKEAQAVAEQHDLDALAPDDPNRAGLAAEVASLKKAAADARAVADAKALEAKAKQPAVTKAMTKCRQFRSVKDSKITQRCN